MKAFEKGFNIVTSTLLAAVVILAILLAGIRLFGIHPYTVLSGSMEPAYHVGSLVYVVKADPEDLKVGDDITYMLNSSTVVTHRIVEILPDEDDPTVLRFRTKGIANNTEDGTPVHENNVIGKVIFTIPALGYFAHFVQTPPGLYIAIAFAVVLLVLVFLPDLLFGKDDTPKAPADASGDASGKARGDQNTDGATDTPTPPDTEGAADTPTPPEDKP
ncbi:MAG: signal peptidase I [Clostridia bacterium]|nr:signal peptidase I [Clostridia bacterium]